jgi:hypothetical protein
MSTVNPEAQPPVQPAQVVAEPRERIRIYGHSTMLYWWPVWVVGFIMAALTGIQGEPITIGSRTELFFLGQNLGVIYTFIVFLVIVFTNVPLRGNASVIAVLGAVFLIVLFAYLGWWDTILSWLPHLSVHMNMGFYILFSTLVFLAWFLVVLVYDHLTYWVVRPGQITQDQVIGGAAKSYDTRGMVFEKVRKDLFRHWLLGLGSGDLRILTTGAKREEIYVHNVLFVDAKVNAIQRLIAIRPDQFAAPVT